MSSPPRTPPLPQYADKPTPNARGRAGNHGVEKLTPELSGDFCKYLRIGARPQQCCGMVRISVATFYGWLKRANDDPADQPSIYRDFKLAVAEAMSAHEMGSLARLTQAATGRTERDSAGNVVSHIPPDPKWDAWMLEHVYSKRYNKQHVEVTGEDGAPIETVSHVATNTSERLTSIVARARARIALRDGGSEVDGSGDTTGAPGTPKPTR